MKKISKVFILLVPLFLALGVMYAVDISTDMTNAVQRMGSGVTIQTGGANVAKLSSRNFKVKIELTGDGNFLIRSRTDSNNNIIGSTSSNILGGKNNTSSGAEGSTIIAGHLNTNYGNYSTIGGGESNIIDGGDSNVILGGAGNMVRGNRSTVVGGNSNKVIGDHSATVGVYNEVRGNNSVALGSGSNVFADGSFLWSDSGVTLSEDNVFAVISNHGMVVNTDTAHSLAQLTVGGSIVISESDRDAEIVCSATKGKGTMKLVSKTEGSTQKCLCSCNGQSWDSLLGDGQCKSVCNGNANIEPECGNDVIVLENADGTKQYSGSCLSGEVIDGSYYMSTENVWWSCQESNGHVKQCNYRLGCTGTVDPNGHPNNNITPDRQIEYQYSRTPGDICTFSCNDGYAWHNNGSAYSCDVICNTSNSNGVGACYFGSLQSLGSPTWKNSYEYWCRYEGYDYKCNMNCPTGMIWAGYEGTLTGCQLPSAACGSVKDQCLLGQTSNSQQDGQLDFTRDCVDSEGFLIASCSLAKPVDSRDVYFTREDGESTTTIGFTITGAIQTGITIRLQKPTGPEMYYITQGAVESDYRPYSSDTSSFTAEFTNGNSVIQLPMPTFVYNLRIVSTGSMNVCTNDFQNAGACRYGATSSHFSSGIVGGSTVNFTWRCTTGGVSKTCSVSRGIKAGNCTSIPTNGTGCDADKSGCNPLKGPNLNLRNFYITNKGAGLVTSNGSGDKYNCVFSGGRINCSDASNMDKWLGWKCKDGFNMNVDACSCTSSSACNSDIYTAVCTNGSTTLGSATYTSGYTYTCPATSETCNAKCEAGKVWIGNECANPVLCYDGDVGFNCYYGSSKNGPDTDNTRNLQQWTCTRGEVTNTCIKCFDGYNWDASSNKCVAGSVPCDSTSLTGSNGIVFDVISLGDGSSTPVTGHDGTQYCTGTAVCNNGTTSLSTMKCTTICGNKTGDTASCKLGSPVGGAGLTYGTVTFLKNYSYACRYDGYTYDACYANCTTNKYWNNTGCVTAPSLCSATHFGCNTVSGKIPASTNHYTGTSNYTWKCSIGDITKDCNENITACTDGCSAGYVSGYYVKALSHGTSTGVTKTGTGGIWSATASCSCKIVTISDEEYTLACDGDGGCNLGYTPTNFDGATYKNEYHYKCDTFSCTSNCPTNQLWHGSNIGCGKINDPCDNTTTDATSSDAYKCRPNGLKIGNKSNITEGYYRDCFDNDDNNNPLNGSEKCYACKSGYVYSEVLLRCVGKTINCDGSLPSNSSHYTKGTGTYTYSGVDHSWTKTSSDPGLCQYKCNQYYNSGNNCDPERLNCGGSLPSGGHYTTGASSYTYNGSLLSWTNVSYTPGTCQFKCDSGYVYSGGKCEEKPHSCIGSRPLYHVEVSSTAPTNDTTSWRESANLNGACTWRCENGWWYPGGSDCIRKPTSFAIVPSPLELFVGDSYGLKVMAYFADGSSKNITFDSNYSIEWEAGDESIIGLSETGNVTGKKKGSTDVTAWIDFSWYTEDVSADVNVIDYSSFDLSISPTTVNDGEGVSISITSPSSSLLWRITDADEFLFSTLTGYGNKTYTFMTHSQGPGSTRYDYSAHLYKDGNAVANDSAYFIQRGWNYDWIDVQLVNMGGVRTDWYYAQAITDKVLCDITVTDSDGSTYVIYSGGKTSSEVQKRREVEEIYPVSVSPVKCDLGDKHHEYHPDY